MSETKRGAPTEDGVYLVHCHENGGNYDAIVKVQNERVYGTGCSHRFSDEIILAHRKHEPLVVPELKKLDVPRKSVIRDSLGQVHWSIIHEPKGWGRIAFFWIDQEPGSTNAFTELTREQCEASGYCYPPECEGTP